MTEVEHQPVVSFRGSSARDRTVIVVDQAPPANTMDPRYSACEDHHLACDCREAELSEEICEWLGNWQAARDAAQEICAGHPTYPEYYDRDYAAGRSPGYVPSDACCQCTGCQIIRKAHL